MCLRFVYHPLPNVCFIRRQTITFYVGDPIIDFTVKKTEAKPRRFVDDKPYKPPKPEKPPGVSKTPLTVTGRTLQDCYSLIQTLESRAGLKLLFNLKTSDLSKSYGFDELYPDIFDFSGIKKRLESGFYENSTDFRRDVDDFLDAVESVFTDHHIKRTATKYRRDIKQAFENLASVDTGIGELRKAFRNMVELDVGDVGTKMEAFDAVTLAEKLNNLSEKKKRKAEWIIRIHCPSLPYYADGIDILKLPAVVIDSLVSLVQS